MFAPQTAMARTRAAPRRPATADCACARKLQGSERHAHHVGPVEASPETPLNGNVATSARAAQRFHHIPVFANGMENAQPARPNPLPPGVHAKLAIGRVDDPHEREADQIADRVMRIPAAATGALCEGARSSTAASPDRSGEHHLALRSPGAPLDRATRDFFEPRFGRDLGHVRVHNDADAAQSASAVGALAYTVGSDVAFAAGQYAPSSQAGRTLLAHELAHTMQAGPPVLRREPTPATQPTTKPVTKPPAKPAPPPKPDFDQIVQEIGPGLGGPYADYEAFAKSMTSATFLGHSVGNGVRKEFLAKLRTAEKKVDAEYTKSGATKPADYGIHSVGGFRSKEGPHGWGLAIDIDGAQNTYLMHEKGTTPKLDAGQRLADAQAKPVYERIAEFILNDPITLPAPIGGPHQSVIPKLITQTGTTLSGNKLSQSERWGEYYDRLHRESEAMKTYFALMQGGTTAIDQFLKGDWKTAHPQQNAPDASAVLTQMWEDYAALGGTVPKGGPTGVQNFQQPASVSPGTRPFSLADPAHGFLTIPREVVVGIGQVLTRWGAIDFGGESGDVMHFDDMDGLGSEIKSATAAAQAKINAAAAAAAATAAGSGSAGSGSAAPTTTPAPPPVSPSAVQQSGEPAKKPAK
jgi:hypothetical protein